MPDASRQRRPKIAILYNESPDWPDPDKDWTAQMVSMLSTALGEEGYESQALKFFASISDLDHYDPRQWLVWNWAEELGGQPWTDSVVAADLEKRGFAYTGSPARTLAFLTHRGDVKERLLALGLPTLPAKLFTGADQAAGWATFPAIVKGANQHGSFGIEYDSIVHDAAQLISRVTYVRDHYADDSLVEPFLDSREFHVGILGNGILEALPPVEYDYSIFTDMHDRLYTYQWKYDGDSRGYKEIKLLCPLPAGDDLLVEKLKATALAAYKAFQLSDYGRIDLRLLGNEPQILDINSNPDLDYTSALMTSARACGLTYNQVVRRIVELASSRMPG